jgi:hypothetical protein
MHSFGVVIGAAGSLVALTAEGILLWGSLRGRWSVGEFQRRRDFQRWFFTGLALAVVGWTLALRA